MERHVCHFRNSKIFLDILTVRHFVNQHVTAVSQTFLLKIKRQTFGGVLKII